MSISSNNRPLLVSLSYLLLLLCIITVNGSPPEDPIKCSTKNSNCTVTNSYGMFPDRTTCRAADAVFPSSEEELVSIVATATKNKRKMKVATRYSHSIPKLVCPDGEDGLLISTNNLNKIHKVDTSTGTITVGSGVTLRQLIAGAAEAGLALPYAPYWWGLTIGGMLGTGAHGSSLWPDKGSAVHDFVVELRIVSSGGLEDGYVKVRTLRESDHDADLDAAKVSLGVLGVISQVTLQLQPLFKRSLTYKQKDDDDLGEEALTFGNQHEFADIAWYPSQGKVLYRIDDRVPSNTSGNGSLDFIGFRSTRTDLLAAARISEELQELGRKRLLKCASAKLRTSVLQGLAFGLTNDGKRFTGYPVIGYQNRLQASGTCLDSPDDKVSTACPWDPRVHGLFFHQTTVTIGMSKVKDFIQDVKALIKESPLSLCGTEQYNGILMRYVTASTAYLGHEEDGIDFDFTYYRSKDPLVARLYEGVLEEIEQMAVFKYGGLPHWGKNRNLAFEGVIKKYKNGEEFIKVKDRFDPLGLFSSEWTDQVLGLKQGLSIVKQGCALEGLCICSEDSHCAPKQGYFCRPGLIYKDARVCATDKSLIKASENSLLEEI